MNKSARLLLTILITCVAAPAAAAPYLRVIQPYEGATLPPVRQSFVFGSVLPATAAVTINGQPVEPHTNGGFLAMVPMTPGLFRVEVAAFDGVSTTTVVRTITIQAPAQSHPLKYEKIDVSSPLGKWTVRAGDRIDVAIQAAPEGEASFRLKSGGESFPLEEQPGTLRGIYKGLYLVRGDDRFSKDDVIVTLRRKDGKKITAKAGATIAVHRDRLSRFLETREEAILLTGPDTDYGYNLFVSAGTRLEITGERDDFYRVAFGDRGEGWIKKSLSRELPGRATPARSVSRNFRIEVNPDRSSTLVTIPLQSRHAYRLEQFTDPHSIRLTLYGVIADSDRINYRAQDSVIKEISWFQSEPETCLVDIQTTQDQPWGYDVRYEGAAMVVEIRHRPPFTGKAGQLRGLRVAIDAGHSKDSYGTIGPWGNTEAQVNLMAAKAVRQALQRRGAEVVMIQDGTKELGLTERVEAAWKSRAHLFVSIHADACAEGQDPRELQGYSVHYYHPQSHAFAKALHEAYGQKTGLRDQGLWRSNLAVCRTTRMPALLLEQAFLILPEYEELMLSPRHHNNVAESLVNGLPRLMSSEPK